MGVDAERMLQSIHTNFICLTHIDYFDGYLELWFAITIRTPLVLLKLRDLRVFLFVQLCIIFWWLESPNFLL